ncbi:DUF6497 family protein [Paracoccus pacificus]|uniref:DUF6497 family protein n=1 Tax=Paracoccus pacificus TaxID=1463598 RepID=A0ABW4R4T7_9RHOB
MRTGTGALLAAIIALPAMAAEITLPSGMKATLDEVINNAPGSSGLTARFRFVAPDLAARVPAIPEPPVDDGVDDGADDGADDGMIPEDQIFAEPTDLPDITAPDITAEAAPETAPVPDEVAAAPAPPDPDPDPGAEAPDGDDETADSDRPLPDDPLLKDMLWLCEHFALPRIAVPGPVPQQIIISIADRPVAFGDADPEVIQVFETFAPDLAAGSCRWEVF